jgi:hypothetical protein
VKRQRGIAVAYKADLNRRLIEAIKHEDTAAVRSLLGQGASINARDLPLARRPLWLKLLGKVLGLPVRPPSALLVALRQRLDHSSAVSDDYETVRALLDYGASVNERDESGATPLHYACVGGLPKTVELLIERGANVNAVARDDSTPLSLARQTDREEILTILEHAGARE